MPWSLSLSLLCALCAAGPDAQPATGGDDPARAPASALPHRVRVELIDGSLLIGTTALGAIPLHSRIGDVRIPLSDLALLERGEGRGTFVALLHNGDRVTGSPAVRLLAVDGILGRLEVPFAKIERVTARGAVGLLPAEGLVLHHVLRGYRPAEHEGFVPDASGNDRAGRYSGPDDTSDFSAGTVEHPFDPASPLFPTDRPFTIAATFRARSGVAGEMMLLSTHRCGSGTDGYWLMVDSRRHGGRARVFVGPEQTEIVGETPIADGLWHTVVATWDGSAVHLYVDGELEGSAETSAPLAYTQRTPLRIGHSYASGAPHARPEKYRFHGEIGEVRVYDRALAAPEIESRAGAAIGRDLRR